VGRIERGLRLLGTSWGVLRAEPELMLLPVMSAVALLLAMIPIAAAWFAAGTPQSTEGYAFLFLYYVVAYSIGVFFSAAMVSAAMEKLRGGDPTLGSALSGAAAKAGPLLAWALVAATVGFILRTLEQRSGLIGRIVFSIIGVAWSVITYFVVPVIMFEDGSTVDSIKRSGHLFKERWGESFIGNGAMGLVFGLLFVADVIIAVVLLTVSPVVGFIVGGLGFVVLMVLNSALSGIFNAALYNYAVSGTGIGGFSADDLASNFRPRRGMFRRS